MKDVEVMKQDLIEQIVIMEKGGLDEEERARAVEKLKADEMRKLDWEIKIDERRDMVGKSKKQKEDLERDVLIINEYIQKYREEEKEKEKRKRCDNDDDNDREAKKQKPVSISLKLYQTLLNYIEHIFFFS